MNAGLQGANAVLKVAHLGLQGVYAVCQFCRTVGQLIHRVCECVKYLIQLRGVIVTVGTDEVCSIHNHRHRGIKLEVLNLCLYLHVIRNGDIPVEIVVLYVQAFLQPRKCIANYDIVASVGDHLTVFHLDIREFISEDHAADCHKRYIDVFVFSVNLRCHFLVVRVVEPYRNLTGFSGKLLRRHFLAVQIVGQLLCHRQLAL